MIQRNASGTIDEALSKISNLDTNGRQRCAQDLTGSYWLLCMRGCRSPLTLEEAKFTNKGVVEKRSVQIDNNGTRDKKEVQEEQTTSTS